MYLYQAEDEEKEWCVVLESLRVVMPLLFILIVVISRSPLCFERKNISKRFNKREKARKERRKRREYMAYNRVNMQTLAKLDYYRIK